MFFEMKLVLYSAFKNFNKLNLLENFSILQTKLFVIFSIRNYFLFSNSMKDTLISI